MPDTPNGEPTSSSAHYAGELKRIGTDVMDDDEKKLAVQPSAAMIDAAARIGLNPLADMSGVSDALHEGGVDAAHRYVDGIEPQYEPELTEKIAEAIAENEREHGPSFRLDAKGKEQLSSIRGSIRSRVRGVFKSQAAQELGSETGSTRTNILVPVAVVAAAALLIIPNVSRLFESPDQSGVEEAKKAELAAAWINDAAHNRSADEDYLGQFTIGEDASTIYEGTAQVLGTSTLPDSARLSGIDLGPYSTGSTYVVVNENADNSPDGSKEPTVETQATYNSPVTDEPANPSERK